MVPCLRLFFFPPHQPTYNFPYDFVRSDLTIQMTFNGLLKYTLKTIYSQSINQSLKNQSINLSIFESIEQLANQTLIPSYSSSLSFRPWSVDSELSTIEGL